MNKPIDCVECGKPKDDLTGTALCISCLANNTDPVGKRNPTATSAENAGSNPAGVHPTVCDKKPDEFVACPFCKSGGIEQRKLPYPLHGFLQATFCTECFATMPGFTAKVSTQDWNTRTEATDDN